MALYDCVCVASQYSKPTVEYIRKRKPELIFVYLFLFIFCSMVVVVLAYNGTLRENVKVGCFRAPDNPISFFLLFLR